MPPQRREQLITVSDLRREAQHLINTGQMPLLEKLLAAVAEAREKYRARLKAARAKGYQEEQ